MQVSRVAPAKLETAQLVLSMLEVLVARVRPMAAALQVAAVPAKAAPVVPILAKVAPTTPETAEAVLSMPVAQARVEHPTQALVASVEQLEACQELAALERAALGLAAQVQVVQEPAVPGPVAQVQAVLELAVLELAVLELAAQVQVVQEPAVPGPVAQVQAVLEPAAQVLPRNRPSSALSLGLSAMAACSRSALMKGTRRRLHGA